MMAPDFLSSVKALSTSLRSMPVAVATSPAETGLPASAIALSTVSVLVIIVSVVMM